MGNSLYEQLLGISKPGIGVYKQGNSVYILYSRNILDALNRNIKNCKFIGWEFTIIETCKEEDIKFLASIHIQEYRNKGYTICNPYTPVKYKIIVRYNEQFKIEVALVSRRGNRKIIGVFDKIQDAKEFAIQQEQKYVIKTNT